MSSTYENKPIWVKKIDGEIETLQRARKQHQDFVEEYDKQIAVQREKRKEWTDLEASGGG